jgi:hypothetical protein
VVHPNKRFPITNPENRYANRPKFLILKKCFLSDGFLGYFSENDGDNSKNAGIFVLFLNTKGTKECIKLILVVVVELKIRMVRVYVKGLSLQKNVPKLSGHFIIE